MLEKKLLGKVALVSGAGKGIGRACALLLSSAGANVIAVARTEADLNQLRDEAQGEVECWVEDVLSKSYLERISSLKKLDILVNNAGTNRPESFIDVSEENLDFVLDLNIRSAFLVSQACSKVMIKNGEGGSIIHMSSQMAHVGSPGRSVYCMTKHGINGLTKAMAVELAEYKIRVNAVSPTFVETDLTRPMLDDPEFKKFVDRMIPMGRMATIDEVAQSVLFLADDGSKMITGHSLKIDGGWTAQ